MDLPRPDGGEPRSCPNGHLLVPNSFIRDWQPCSCEAALANHGGHHRVQCWRCREEMLETVVSYRPPCPDRFLVKV